MIIALSLNPAAAAAGHFMHNNRRRRRANTNLFSRQAQKKSGLTFNQSLPKKGATTPLAVKNKRKENPSQNVETTTTHPI